ncbi:MAG: 4-alpha-glucanotransferase [Chloroflexi bacterium]|nr:4-alpha-glucanotransferase [Chloroflexota bacterium]
MPFPRASGILLHPTSLPGRFGIGDLGAEAFRWIDFLKSADQKLWQILPLGPTGYGDSPYQCFSAFAGNPYLISPEKLLEDGLLSRADLDSAPNFPAHMVDYGPVIQFKLALLEKAHRNFCGGAASPTLRAEFESFKHDQRAWLDDFALFMALKESHNGAVWSEWEPELVSRQVKALAASRERLADSIESQCLRQFLFFRHWKAVKEYAGAAGIKIIGDIPIFVAYDSADVWAHPELFYLDERGQSTVVAGVPPDYFSRTGQLWGNPLYRWEALKQNGYAWWIDRFHATLAFVDIVRLDHFRGFEAYWEIPAGMPTAEVGRWVKGPGADFFAALQRALGSLPIIAEDLGVVTPEMTALRDQFDLPGMKVLQFAFSSDSLDLFLPHNFIHNCVVYTGTHDNDTTRGWYEHSSTERERDFARRYLARDGGDVAWDLIRLAFATVADTAVAPLQDILNLGTESRMNLPGRPHGNWGWRFVHGQLTDAIRDRLKAMTNLYAR